jgi:hypothetical protein
MADVLPAPLALPTKNRAFTGVVGGSDPAGGRDLRSGATMMRDCDAYAVASRDIVFESFDGEAVVLNLANGKYFGFSDSGSRVW